jgi:hypothetical protein
MYVELLTAFADGISLKASRAEVAGVLMGIDDEAEKEIAFHGTVIEIGPTRRGHPHLKWLVTLHVDSVVRGRLEAETFSINIHSPIKSGIAVGGRYLIQATRINTDEYLIKGIKPLKD